MTLPERTPSRKPRWIGLWGPFALAGMIIIGIAAAWFWMRGEVVRRMDAAASAAPAGWTLAWGQRRISGFPFRLDVDLTDARVREPSGWGVAAPRLKAEAFIFAPLHWVAVAPDGAVLTRRRGGPVLIRAKVLRASLSEPDRNPPRFSLEGIGLTFSTDVGGSPFLLRSAEEAHLHTRAGPDDQGAIYLEIDRASAQLSGLMARIAENKPLTLIADATYDHASAFSGQSWTDAARSWRAAGGRLTVRRLSLLAGEAELQARSGELSIGPDGRLRGTLPIALKQASRTLQAMASENAVKPEVARSAQAAVGAEQAGPVVSLPLAFQAGQTTLGPVALGPAPRIY